MKRSFERVLNRILGRPQRVYRNDVENFLIEEISKELSKAIDTMIIKKIKDSV